MHRERPEKLQTNGKVVWRKRALDQLNKQYNYIRKGSPQSAEKVKSTLLDMAEALKDHPEKFPMDKYFKGNKGDVQAFEKFSL